MKTPVEMVAWALENPWYCLGAFLIYSVIGFFYFLISLKGTKKKSNKLTELAEQLFLSLLALPGVIFGLALISIFLEA